MKNYTKHTKMLFVAIFGFVGIAFAASRQSPLVTKVASNDGDTLSSFATSCSSTTWTAISASDFRTRRITIQNLTGGQTVCLSSGSVNSNLCTATAPSYKLISPSVYEYYSEAGVYCRTLDAQTAQTIHGIKYYDSKDSTTVE